MERLHRGQCSQWLRGYHGWLRSAIKHLLDWNLAIGAENELLHYVWVDKHRLSIARWRALFVWLLVLFFSAFYFIINAAWSNQRAREDLWLKELGVSTFDQMGLLEDGLVDSAFNRMRENVLGRFENEVSGARTEVLLSLIHI